MTWLYSAWLKRAVYNSQSLLAFVFRQNLFKFRCYTPHFDPKNIDWVHMRYFIFLIWENKIQFYLSFLSDNEMSIVIVRWNYLMIIMGVYVATAHDLRVVVTQHHEMSRFVRKRGKCNFFFFSIHDVFCQNRPIAVLRYDNRTPKMLWY
jgi:hypothetical protein